VIPEAIGILAALLLLPTLGVFIVIVGAVDGWLYKRWGVEATISRGMERLWKCWPWIPAAMFLLIGFTLGLLTGHFGWPQPPIP
jgi:hypothetical protein